MNTNQPKKLNKIKTLFGREKPISQLQLAFKNACRGYGRIVLVPGHSGIGKTSLVQYLEKPVEYENGLFVTGKFDQYQLNTPYYAFRQALKKLWSKIFLSNQSTHSEIAAKIRESVGDLGFLLAELIPETNYIFSEQPHREDSNINYIEARHRFTTVIRKFIEIVSLPEQPIVIFIDDWQWADSASLELLKDLHDENVLRYFLIIAAYRDEEVDRTHPFNSVMRDLNRQIISPEVIRVNRLDENAVGEMINQALNAPVEKMDDFFRQVFHHTQGNPFHIKVFLEFLYENKLLWFDSIDQFWHWTIEETLPKSIVDLFVKKLNHFNPESRNLISLAACLGNQFDIDILSVIGNLSLYKCHALLEPLKSDGLILAVAEILTNQNSNNASSYQHFSFMHDRIQQAAYLLIEPEMIAELHLKIGRLLLTCLNENEIDERLFEVLEHLNAGKQFIHDSDEQKMLVELNMSASLKARSATAFRAMLKFNGAAFHFANEMVGGIENFWNTNYEKALVLHRDLAESEFLEGDRGMAVKIIQESLFYTKTPIERAKSLNILIAQYTLLAKYEDAISLGRQALAEFGISLPRDNFETFRDDEIRQIREKLTKNSISSLYDCPFMDDPDKLMVTKLLITLGPPCYRTHQRLWSVIVPKVVNITLDYGLVPQIGYSHTALGGLLGWVDNDYQSAKELGDLSERIMGSKFDSTSDQSVFYLMIGSSIRHWFKHLSYASMDYIQAYEVGQQSGNLQYAAYGFGHNMYCRFFQGVQLHELIQDTQQSLTFSRTRLNHWAIDLLEGGLCVFKNLASRNDNPDNISIDDSRYLQQVGANKNIQVLCIYKILNSYYHLLLDHREYALSLSDEAEELIYTVGIQGLLPWPEHVFIRFLILSAHYNDAGKEARLKMHSELYRIREQLRIWSENCAENYSHKYLLASAEINRIEKEPTKAILLYDRAIEAATKNNFIQWEGIANERAYNFWVEQQNDFLAQIYWQQAYTCYQRWGATAKLALMEKEFSKKIFCWHLNESQSDMADIELTDNEKKEFLQKHIGFLKRQSKENLELQNQKAVSKEAEKLAEAIKRLRIEIAERKLAQQKLDKAVKEAMILKTAIDQIPVGVAFANENFQLYFCNAAGLGLRGGDKEALIKISKEAYNNWQVLKLNGEPYEIEKLPLVRTIAEKRIIKEEFIVRHADGSDHICDAIASPIFDNQKKILGGVIIFPDITEKRLLESRLQQAQKMESIGTLAGGIAHDFNNLLYVVMGNISLAQDDLSLEIETSENLKEAEKACILAKELTSRLITFSKGGDPVKKMMPINGLLKDMVVSELSGSNIKPKISIADAIRNVNIDEGQIKQVVRNIVVNAKEAMDDNGQLTVSCENVDIAEKDYQALSQGEYIKISFTDQGCGISKENLKKIFDPYFSTKDMGADKGQGLGLTVSYSIVQKHGGLITVESELEAGSTFSVYLPGLSAKEPDLQKSEKKPAAQKPVKQPATGTGKILLMDDEKAIRAFLSRVINRLGYAVETCTEGKEAIEIYQKAMESKEPFDVVILDLTNKIGMGGQDTMKRLLKIDPDVKGIIITGYSDDPLVANFRAYGFSGSLTKPTTRDELSKVINEVLSTDQ